MNPYDIFELAQLRAIHSAIEPTSDSIWRMKCRDYSVRFHTPLHVVMNELDPLMVLQALYEDQFHPSIVDEELQELLDKLYVIKDPEYSRMSKEETEELVDSVLNKELERASRKKRITQQTIEKEIKEAEVIKPKQGSMSFGDLEKIDEEAEANKSGFED